MERATDEVSRQFDPKLWEITYNPSVAKQTVSRNQIKRELGDPVFRKSVEGLVEASRPAAGGARVVSAESFPGTPDLRRLL